MRKRKDLDILTTAECDVLGLVKKGMTDREIALERETAVKTVNNQMQSIRQKLGVYSRLQAALADYPEECQCT